ncbi:alpha/beta hydrolase [Arthrobacter sp. TS-15]|uniref:alpha/beta hydrolase n=1 Tax=Arthrobacter sp. TS-15 TaxID=2510797 RepID=UPI00115E2F0E|nr:alpha/beta hydrolase [Arthrobacter sp. TS-15]TQS87372.1 alpha/beta hydrolase [Arthrobacter sp. TS-15]
MPVDADVQALLDTMDQQGLKSFEQLSVDESRGVIASFTTLQKPRQGVGKVVDALYPVEGGHQALRIYIPEAAGPLPVILYFHGGGFIAGDLEVVEEPNRSLANDTSAIVVAASYRLAPENRFPAATDDALAALRWVQENIEQYGGDAGRLAVMGDSAGGNLATVTAIRARDEGGPQLRAQVLVYPVIDPAADLPSRAEFKEGYLLTAAGLDSFWDKYLSSPQDAEDPHAVPSKTPSLAGLPPALVLTTEYEVARDEAEAYAKQLTEAGVETEALRFDGLIHGAYWMSGVLQRSDDMHQSIVQFLAKRLAD